MFTLAAIPFVVFLAPSRTEAPSAQVERVVIAGDAGWQLVGAWRRPASAGSVPAVLLLHRAAGTRAEYDALALALAARGLASLALDLRGHGESTNLGRFQEPYSEHLHINEGAHLDVIAALEWLAARAGVDPDRLAVVGASYSGEAAAVAARSGARRVAAYVMLSPGNFSDESVGFAARDGARWIFIRTALESKASLVYIDEVFNALQRDAPSVERRVIDGAGHATHMLDTRPELVTEIAEWLRRALGASPLEAP
jgi:dienelactone hydrolase